MFLLYTQQVLIVIDCAINWLLGGSFSETLSSRAHRMRVKPQPYFWWLAGAIDALFFWQDDHCYQSWLAHTKIRPQPLTNA